MSAPSTSIEYWTPYAKRIVTLANGVDVSALAWLAVNGLREHGFQFDLAGDGTIVVRASPTLGPLHPESIAALNSPVFYHDVVAVLTAAEVEH